jgi:hypothetical protein
VQFDVYGRFRLEVAREHNRWVVCRLAPGKRIRDDDIVIPRSLLGHELATFLDDHYHELATPGDKVKPLP